MKKVCLFTASMVVAMAATFTPAILHFEVVEVKAASSSYSTYTLPSTIDLNPVSEADIRSYYSSLEGKNLQGNDLLKALKPILKNGQQYARYPDNRIWQAYEITDRDWELSPASSTTYGTYDPVTNIISDYEYGTSASNPKNNPYQHLFYRNRGVEDAKWRAWDNHGSNNGTDREHIWAKGHGFGEENSIGAIGDLHHLVAADSYVNSSSHNYYSYGFVDPNKIDDDAGAKFKINGNVVVAGNYRGTSQTLGGGIVFEPQDCDKGDIARACFYMVARYNNLAGNDNTIDAGNPNLTLIDTVSPKETIVSTATNAVGYGLLTDLLAWHRLDPVDDYEIHRNDLIYRNFDKNRNPFIDFPHWVDAIWGSVEMEADGRTVKTRDATPKGMAKPSTDKVYAKDAPSPTPSSSQEQTSATPATSTPATSSAAPSVSSQSSSGGETPATGFNLPTPVIIAIVAGAVILLVVLILVATLGKGKSKKAAKKVLKNVTKSSSSGKKKKK